jgi:hypothetical protein
LNCKQNSNERPRIQNQVKVAPTTISYDFVLDKTNLTEQELDVRYIHYSNVFVKDVEDTTAASADQGAATMAAGNITRAEFNERLLQLRFLIQELSISRIKQVFQVRAKEWLGKLFPQCKSLDDYLAEYRNGEYGNKMRKMAHTICNVMWGKRCNPMIEKMVMNKLGLVYDNYVFVIKDMVMARVTPKTRRECGNIRKFIGRLRQTLIADRFR